MVKQMGKRRSSEPLSPSTATALYELIAKQFGLMIARNMRFAPRPEEIGPRAKLLVDDLIAVRQTDPGRIAGVLEAIGRLHTEWPSTGQIIGMLKERAPAAHRDFPKLPSPEMKDEERENARKILAEAKRRIGLKTAQKTREAEADLIAAARKSLSKNPITRAVIEADGATQEA